MRPVLVLVLGFVLGGAVIALVGLALALLDRGKKR
jgi:hypothetical protein